MRAAILHEYDGDRFPHGRYTTRELSVMATEFQGNGKTVKPQTIGSRLNNGHSPAVAVEWIPKEHKKTKRQEIPIKCPDGKMRTPIEIAEMLDLKDYSSWFRRVKDHGLATAFEMGRKGDNKTAEKRIAAEKRWRDKKLKDQADAPEGYEKFGDIILPKRSKAEQQKILSSIPEPTKMDLKMSRHHEGTEGSGADSLIGACRGGVGI